jgi:hypothetical protein
MRTQHGLLTFLVALVLAPVVLPIGAWFVLLLLPATVLVIPTLLISGILAVAALLLSAGPTAEMVAGPPGPRALRPIAHAA